MKKDKNNYSRFISSIKIVLLLQLIVAIVYVIPIFIDFKNENIKDIQYESMPVTDEVDISYNLLNDNVMLDTLLISSTTPITSIIISKDMIESSQQVDTNEEYVEVYQPEKQNDNYQTNIDNENVIISKTSDIVDDKKESTSMEEIIDDMNAKVGQIFDIGSTLLSAFSDALEKENESFEQQNDRVDDDSTSGNLDVTDGLLENIDTTTDQYEQLKQYCQNNNGVLTKITDILWDTSNNYYSFPYVCVLNNSGNVLNFFYDDITNMSEEKWTDFE